MTKSKVTILAIESSCDETAAAVLSGQLDGRQPQFKVLSNIINSQVAIHQKTGGVVPEVAARAHVQNILPVTKAALKRSRKKLADLDYVAVTSGPGLIVSLIVGTEFAKGLAAGGNVPLLPTNHMAGHLYSAFAQRPEKIMFPVLSLVVSGGHTLLILMKSYADYRVIGGTVDDAAGEAFDKVARLLGFPYPGGPAISKLAQRGQSTIKFPRPMLQEDNFDFSFSGLKTAVLYYLDKQKKPLSLKQKADIAASFETAVVDVLVKKTLRAAQKYHCQTVALSGGVAANYQLRSVLAAVCEEHNLAFTVPPLDWCTDNAQMIALAAYFNLRAGQLAVAPRKVKADPLWELK